MSTVPLTALELTQKLSELTTKVNKLESDLQKEKDLNKRYWELLQKEGLSDFSKVYSTPT